MQKKEIARFLLLVQMSLIIYQESPFPEKRPFSYFFTNTDTRLILNIYLLYENMLNKKDSDKPSLSPWIRILHLLASTKKTFLSNVTTPFLYLFPCNEQSIPMVYKVKHLAMCLTPHSATPGLETLQR